MAKEKYNLDFMPDSTELVGFIQKSPQEFLDRVAYGYFLILRSLNEDLPEDMWLKGWLMQTLINALDEIQCFDIKTLDATKIAQIVIKVSNIFRTFLFHVIEPGRSELVVALLMVIVKNAAVKFDFSTPLHVAAETGGSDIVRMLLNFGVDKEVMRSDRARPLHLAVCKGHQDVVELLLNNGASAKAWWGENCSLHLGVEAGHASIVRLLLAAGAYIDAAKPNNGATALHLAAGAGHLDMVMLLLDAGANKSVVLKNGATPLYLATKEGHFDVMKALHGSDVSEPEVVTCYMMIAKTKDPAEVVKMPRFGGLSVNPSAFFSSPASSSFSTNVPERGPGI